MKKNLIGAVNWTCLFLSLLLCQLLLCQGISAQPLPTSAHSSPLHLSQQHVLQMILKNSNKAKEANLQGDLSRLALVQATAGYDYNIGVESGYEISKIPNFLGTQPDKDQIFKTVLSANKPIANTGTLLGLEYTRIAKKTDYQAGISVPSEQTEDYFGVSIQQALLKNSFGRADRARVRAAEYNYEASQLSKNEELQTLALDGLRLYWKAYVASETYSDSVRSRDRYQKLVEAVRKKTSYGYNNPGELAQVQAELEVRNQNVRTKLADFQTLSRDLTTALGLPNESEIIFETPKDLPKPPQNQTSNNLLESLRSYKILQKKVEAADESFRASDSGQLPDLALVAKYYQYGLKPTASEATTEMLGGTKPDLYIGIKLSYSFGSDLQSEDAKNKQINQELTKTQLARRGLELKDNLEKSERNVQTSLALFESAKLQRTFREKATQEQTKAYNQGRTDINNLIVSMNNFFDSEVLYTKTMSDYLMAINEHTALRDQLVSDLNDSNGATPNR